MDDWLKLVLVTLACYRLAQLIAFDEGPLGIFHKLRIATGAYNYDKQGQPQSTLGRLITCPYCLGMWIALPLALYADLDLWWLWWLAIAGGQTFLQGLTNDS